MRALFESLGFGEMEIFVWLWFGGVEIGAVWRAFALSQCLTSMVCLSPGCSWGPGLLSSVKLVPQSLAQAGISGTKGAEDESPVDLLGTLLGGVEGGTQIFPGEWLHV
eukprot:CAMPEP_0173391958 /NCGR_PEP_ID=MMETSP1356-20130122/18679_1 /TAXON_ID=77927 ORGANISM="Hemiselmis virescens, Strain PCC157" /NCGR_SAMPLE_ID=MMETSP1356 /ASSEMBLY_ACC=CAM_ASM_000847 /LENGTH=107 /DNA_ID=CAMNT_0014349665 /DNA_START=571 /DNA_END=894 /DNA_ORIENTATION=+